MDGPLYWMRPKSKWWRVAAIVLLAAFGIPAASWMVLVATAPSVARLARIAPTQTSYMRVRDREAGRASGSGAIRWVAINTLPTHAVCSVVKAEDREFFRHSGFHWAAIRRGFLTSLSGSEIKGGSTISQQLSRNLFLSPQRSLVRKLREAAITYELERSLTKQRILELYLNSIEFGDGVWGIGAASQHYFQKHPSRLTPFEATFLASLIAAPRKPLDGPNGERAYRVQRRVLNQLQRAGLLQATDVREAKRAAVALARLLREGMTLPEALARTRGLDEGTSPSPYRRVDPEELPEDECGLEQELLSEHRWRPS